MLEEMPDYVWRHWMAYQRMRDPEYRQQVEWEIMDEKERLELQESASLGIIRAGKAVAKRRAGH